MVNASSEAIYDKNSSEIKTILRASLTNNPNLDMKALASADENFADSYESLSEMLVRLKEILSLPKNAELGDILGEVKQIISTTDKALSNDDTRLNALEGLVAELQIRHYETTLQTANDSVSSAMKEGKLPPSLKEWAISLCAENKKSFSDFVDRMPPMFSHLSKISATAGIPNNNHKILSDDQMSVCKALGHSSDEFVVTMTNQQKG